LSLVFTIYTVDFVANDKVWADRGEDGVCVQCDVSLTVCLMKSCRKTKQRERSS